MAGRFPPRTPTTRTTVRGGHVPVPTTPVALDTQTDLGLTLGPLRRGPADPTFRVTPDGSVWRASRTPDGPGTLRVAVRQNAGTDEDPHPNANANERTDKNERTDNKPHVTAEAWGPGAPWLLARLPALLGAEDDPTAFVPRHRLLAATHRRRLGLRLTRTGLVLESLIPSVLEQKVTTDEAYRAWRLLVRKYGEPAPGPAPDGMHVMPDARTWALIPSWEWHRAGVEDKRAATIVRAARAARRMEEAADMAPADARARLELIPGIGPWTSAETIQRSNGAPDEVTTGDLHLPGIVGWALAGDRTADDAAMLDLLAPYAGQRHRAARLILLSGRVPPRRAPRMTPGNIARY
ncbi:DNA-3-methyladenine glycosylase 2 family protein [Streptomyces sp. NBC_00090]|uniref:DNA-3-methyladenine glycosylase family protein n=1 Tax=Streptomyces sp. NBC_00090 TaxID=2903619 RepID=UPI0032527BE9